MSRRPSGAPPSAVPSATSSTNSRCPVRCRLSLISTYAYVNPVVAVLLGSLFRDEPLTSAVVVGGAVTVAGVVLVVRGERPDAPI